MRRAAAQVLRNASNEVVPTASRLPLVSGELFGDGAPKSRWVPPAGFCLEIFFWGEFLCFCRGFWRKRVVDGGFLVVNLWWNCGELWCVDGRILGFENLPFLKFIFEGFPFWEWVLAAVESEGGFGLGQEEQDEDQGFGHEHAEGGLLSVPVS